MPSVVVDPQCDITPLYRRPNFCRSFSLLFRRLAKKLMCQVPNPANAREGLHPSEFYAAPAEGQALRGHESARKLVQPGSGNPVVKDLKPVAKLWSNPIISAR